MSRSAGTGSPAWFTCTVDRQERFTRSHQVELTGRERPYQPKRGTAIGTRSTFVAREYRCTCGHVGWSNHVDLARLAGATDDDHWAP